MSFPLLALALGCTLLEEQRSLPTDVTWSGYVYADLPADAIPWLEAGTVQVTDLDDNEITTGTQLDGTPGYWEFDVPVDIDVAIRVSGGDQVPTLWRGRTPAGRAYWLTGALFAINAQTEASFFDSLNGWQGLSPSDLSQGEIAHLWGAPQDREAWAGAMIEVTDSDGSAQVVALAVDADGALIDAGTGPIDYFVAPNLVPGDVSLRVIAADGRVAETTWPAHGGDLLSAFYFSLPSF
ncbi:MAG: hypothetical protein GXP62_20480 [Oligoflexia bacterium]|nr:hypothetical protein [Oligoflexia bacterium]